MRGRMLKGELGCELAVDGAREVDSAVCQIDVFEGIARIHTDPSPVFETRSSILSVFWGCAVASALSMNCEAAMWLLRDSET